MGTWIKETDKAIYLMEGNGYVASVMKQPSQTNGKEKVADITPLKSWFARSDRPGGMTVALGAGAPEPEPVRPDDGLIMEHNGMLKVVNDTYFKLSPKNSSDLSNQEKVFVKADSIFNFRSYQDVGNYHWQVELKTPLPGSSATTSWYVFTPHIRLMTDAILTVTHDTYFKLEPKLSSVLPNSAKVLVRQGTPFNVESFFPAAGDHTQIELADVTLGANNGALWYIYNLHFRSEVNDGTGGGSHNGMQIRTVSDTYFTLSPKPSSELPNQQKVLVRQGTIFNIQYYTDVGDKRWRVELVEPMGDVATTSWYVDTRATKLVSPITLTVTQDTSFKLEPRQSLALPDTSKMLVRQNTQFQLVLHLPAANDHTQVELANVGLGSTQETTWYAYNPHIAVEGQRQLLRVVSDTMFKSSTASSSDLPEDAKVFVPRNTVFELSDYHQPKRNHIKVTLKGAFLGTHQRNIWYCYLPDIYIMGTEIGNHPTDSNTAGPPANPGDRGFPLQFPGFTGTYYSNDPILRVTQHGEPGHFTWGEALHVDPTTGNYRRPASADVIYSIQRIAKVMEDIRKRYGDRPIKINSWYRDPATNTAVGGASQSRHMIGDALDFVVPGVHPYTVYADLDTWWGSKGGLASSSTFTHLDGRGYRARWDYDYWYFTKNQESWGTWVKETDVALYLMRSGAWISRIMKTPSAANSQEKVLDISPMQDWFTMANAPARMTISIGTGAPEPEQWIEPPTSHTGETNAEGIELVKHFEGLRTTAYQDSVGVWTIGYGHTSMAGPPRVSQGMTITTEEAETILKQDLDVFEQGVANALAINTNEDQFSAMVSFSFNVGLGAFRNSTLLRKHNAGDFSGAADEFLRWVYAGGEILPGLERRRKAERALYLSQNYSQFIGRTTASTSTNYSRVAAVTAGAAAIAGLAFGAYNLFSGPPKIETPPVQETPKDLSEPVGYLNGSVDRSFG